MEFLDNVIDVLRAWSLETYPRTSTLQNATHRNCRTDEEGKNECYEPRVSLARTSPFRTTRTNYILMRSPRLHIDGIEKSQERETPGDPIDDDFLSFRSKLVDDGTQEEEMDQ